jgi:CHRD domain-containing protein
MRKLYAILVVSLAALTMETGAFSQPLARTFAVPLTAAEEAPPCAATDQSDRGVALRIVAAATGTVEYTIVSTASGRDRGFPWRAHPRACSRRRERRRRPGIGADGRRGWDRCPRHVHQPQLVAVALETPELFYVNVHTTTCPGGAIRGQLA